MSAAGQDTRGGRDLHGGASVGGRAPLASPSTTDPGGSVPAIPGRVGAAAPYRRCSPVPTSELAALYATGLSLRAVGERVGMTGPGVLLRLRDAGIERRRRGGAPVRDWAPWAALRADGASWYEIGRRLGVSHTAARIGILRHLAREGR